MIKKKDNQLVLTITGIILFHIVIFVAATIITTPFYETEDDNTMAGIALGLYGKRDYHLVYMNVIVGKLINLFAASLNIVNWYTVFQYVTLFCAFVTIYVVLIKDADRWRAIFITILIGATFCFQFYHSIQFTKTAGAATMAGIVLLVDLIEREQKNFALAIWGGILLILGSLYRFDGYGMVLCTCFLWVFVFFYRNIKEKNVGKIKQYLLYFGVPIVLSVLFYLIDISIYQTNDAWKEYGSYNELRSELLDFGFPKFEENQHIYDSLSLGNVDYINYSLWDFADTEKLTVDIMEQLVESKDSYRHSINIWNFLKKGYTVILGMPFLFLIPIGGIYFLLHKKRDKTLLIALVIGALGVEAYFIYIGRYQLPYTNAVIALSLIVLMCYSSKKKEYIVKSRWLNVSLFIAGCVFIALIACKWYMQGIEQKYEQNQNADRDEVTSLIYQDKENFYFTKVGHGIETFTDIWEPVEEGQGANSATLGDWLTMSPIVLEQWGKYGVSNPYRALSEMENTYLVDDFSSYWKHQYILANYNEDAKMVLEKNIGGYQIWKFTDREVTIDKKKCKENTENILYSGYLLNIDETGQFVRGYLYEKDTNSFNQRVYLGVVKAGEDTEVLYPMEQTRNDKSDDLYNGKYSGFSLWNDGIIDFENDQVNLYLENENGLYQIEFSESE